MKSVPSSQRYSKKHLLARENRRNHYHKIIHPSYFLLVKNRTARKELLEIAEQIYNNLAN